MRCQLRSESLEPRVVLAADPLITEFMASNDETLRDNDGTSSDWIEIFNPDADPLDLSGWYLTDDAADLTKWQFPTGVTLDAQQYLVVFASDKDRQDADGELHTNFRLSGAGEYLGLVKPDGITIASDLGLDVPEQFTDVSYGYRMADAERRFVQVGSAAQVLVPTDGALGTTWTQPEFQPGSAWLTELSPGNPITVGIGFDASGNFAADIQTDVGSLMQGVNASLYVRIPFELQNVAELEDLFLRIKYDDGYVLYLNGSPIDLQNASFFSTFNSTATAERNDAEAIVFEEVELLQYRDRLREGMNVLAIHALNRSVSDDDLLLVPEIFSSGLELDTTVAGYFTTPTPGAVNLNEFALGPRIGDVTHTLPEQPGVGDAVVVTAEVSPTLNPIQSVSLVYRVMYDAEITVMMTDDGTGADTTAGDGIYAATIPADVAAPSQMLRWYVTATDTSGEPMRNPRVLDTTGLDQSPQYYGTVIADPSVSDNLPVFHWFTENVSRSRTRTGARTSVFYAGEFYDNVYVRQRGGATNGSSQKFNFNDDQKFFVNEEVGRVVEINMNAQGSDPSYLRQSLAFESYAWAGNETSASFLMNVRVNGRADRIGVFIEQVNEDYLIRHGLDPEGAIYKFVQRSTLMPAFADTTTGLEKKTRLDEGNADIQAVVNGLTRSTADARADSVFDHFDLAQVLNYLAVRAVTMDADDVRKNFYLYRDTNGTGQWSMFPWDKDWTFGVTGDGGPSLSHPFFGSEAYLKTNANQWNRLYDTVFTDPVLQEMYLRRLRTVMDELLQPPGTTVDEGRYEQRIAEMLAEAGNTLPSGAISQANSGLRNYFPGRRETLYLEHSIDNLSAVEPIDMVGEFYPGIQYFVPTDESLGTSWTGLQAPANAAAWQIGTSGFGFGTSAGFSDLIRTPVEPRAACADCNSLYLRIPFTVADPTAIEALSLRMKFDDGFIAYINGVEVARKNATGDPTYNMRATRAQANQAAIQFENFNISQHLNLLRQGDNILAVHSLNNGTNSSDQLIMPVLINGVISDSNAAGIPHAQTSNPPVVFGTFEHNPASGNQDEEYIELRNPLNTAVDISGWRLTGGVEHTFRAGTVIPSNGSLFVSPSVPDFLARSSGPAGNQGLVVQGNYQGHLSNFGETVQLLAADGTPMDQLTTPITPSDAQLYLRISELYYNPPGLDESTEFVELTNISSGAAATTLELSGVTLSGGPSEPFTFPPGTSLAPGAFLVVARDPAVLQSRFPNLSPQQVLGPMLGALSNTGETLVLDDGSGSTVLEFSYSDSALWPLQADGGGSSLELISPSTTRVNVLSKPSVWRASLEIGGTPGRAASTPLGVVINEVLANPSGPGQADAIELYNASTTTVNLTGWFLSDTANDLEKYAFPDGTSLAPGQYLVITASQFNNPATGDRAFGLSGSAGDEVWLVRSSLATGVVTDIVDMVAFGATAPGESLGRVPNGSGVLTPLRAVSLGQANGSARVGPIVISEVHYHPAPPSPEAIAIYPELNAGDLEFIELHNPTAAPVSLAGWRLRGGIDFDFEPTATIAPFGTLLVVSFAPERPDNADRAAAFRTEYGLTPNVRMVGGYTGQLSDSHERIQLQRPGTPPVDDPTAVPYLFEDEVRYDDRAPWPTQADGQGSSLTRLAPDAYGNQFTSWRGAEPTPAAVRFVNADLNNDGQITVADIDRLCVAIRQADIAFDMDGSGATSSEDLQFFVEQVLGTSIGDANLDGVFNSRDFVVVFQAGEYEDATTGNSTWGEGDWNCDGDFDTRDLVAAFQAGGFVTASIPAASIADETLHSAVAAPNTDLLFAIGSALHATSKLGRETERMAVDTEKEAEVKAAPNRLAVLATEAFFTDQHSTTPKNILGHQDYFEHEIDAVCIDKELAVDVATATDSNTFGDN
jgi:hypothetical protein